MDCDRVHSGAGAVSAIDWIAVTPSSGWRAGDQGSETTVLNMLFRVVMQRCGVIHVFHAGF
jgi:hypothetical protein